MPALSIDKRCTCKY